MASETIRGRQECRPSHHWRLDGDPSEPASPIVIALHGYGMDEDFFALLLQRLFDVPVRFLLPRAPMRGEIGLAAKNGSSWYAYDGDQVRFRQELERLEVEIPALVTDVEAAQGLAPRARYLLGFSQGGYGGSWVALRRSDLFDGMIVSGARVKTEWLEDEMRAAAASGFRALLCHGQKDRSVKPEAAERSRRELVEAGVNVEYHTFDTGHSLGRAQVSAMADWLARSTNGARP
jgi:phospholipase/carboxylesterase